MVKNEDVALAFAYGREERAANMYTDGRVVWSFEDWFPIAMRIGPGKFLFNKDGYSTTTTQHKARVRRHLRDEEIIECTTEELIKAVNDPGEPIIIQRDKEFESVDEVMLALRDFLKRKGLKYAPITKWKDEIIAWVTARSL